MLCFLIFKVGKVNLYRFFYLKFKKKISFSNNKKKCCKASEKNQISKTVFIAFKNKMF